GMVGYPLISPQITHDTVYCPGN
ncbi:MAG: hypothetical protein HW373_87, partial [Deltaproteobacteria bacterium]|nr:hypothetical protein [Deltaproteobacteria bacterium]